MKTGIITFHFAFNQGAVLQCYAMQKYLKIQKNEAYVINYCPKYHTVLHSAWRNPFYYSYIYWKKSANRPLSVKLYLYARSFVRCMYWNITGIDRKNQIEFRTFLNKNLNLTREYRNLKQLQKNPPEMDTYISGSDQLWNPELLGGDFDKAYFLDFGNKDINKVTYAVSMGKIHEESVLVKLKALCADLTAVSLREYSESAAQYIGRDVHICLDPTLLLDADDYSDVESRITEDEPYIFIYGFETNESLKKAVKLAQEKYKCRIINGSPKWIRLGNDVKIMSGYGPDRFLTLIKNAQCVITNSFHGTAFSIIYKKDFITIPHSTRGKRMADLLSKLDLSYRLMGENGFSFDTEIDFTKVYERLNVFRSHSMEYLNLAGSGHRGEEIPHYPEDEITESSSGGDKKLNAYYGYYRNDVLLKQSASGGAATALSEFMIHDGGIVVGVAYSDDFRSARFCCIEKEEELYKLKGSKYIPPKTDIDGKLVFDIVGDILEKGKKVLFIGSGCHVGALYKRLEIRNITTENLYTIDLICHGPTIQAVYEDFIKTLENRFGAPVTAFNMRHKKNGWVPPYIHAIFANGKQYSKPLYETDLGFALRICVRESCYQCKFKGERHLADITIGDYWGIQSGMKEYNKNGVSVMITRSEKGTKLVESLDRETFFTEHTDVDRILKHNIMYADSLRKAGYVDRFKADLEEKGLHYAVVHSEGYRDFKKYVLKSRIKRILL